MSTTAELCVRAIDGWKKAQDFLIGEFIPQITLLSFIYGNMTDKKRKAFDKKYPEIIKFLKEQIRLGGEIVLQSQCPQCKKKITIEDKFCSNCGEKI